MSDVLTRSRLSGVGCASVDFLMAAVANGSNGSIHNDLGFEMFGIGPIEFLIFLVVGLISFGLPIATIVMLVLLLKQRNSDRESIANSLAELRTENQRLRDDLAAVIARTGWSSGGASN